MKKKKEELSLLDTELAKIDKFKTLVASAFAFKRIKTAKDFYLFIGYSKEELPVLDNRPIIYEEVKKLLAKEREKIIAKHSFSRVIEEIKHLFSPEFKLACQHILPEHALSLQEKALTIPDADESPEVLYYFRISPKQTAKLRKFQERTTTSLLKKIIEEKKQGILLLAGVGTGKTFILGKVIRQMQDMNYFEGRTMAPWPVVYVTKASVVTQTERVLRKSFGVKVGVEVEVINIDQLRSKFGELMVRDRTVIKDNEPHVIWEWRRNVHPLMIIWDECQALKNEWSQQSQIGQSFNDIVDQFNVHTIQIFSSATPFITVSEAKCFAVATRIPFKYGVGKPQPLTNELWPQFAKEVAFPDEPNVISPNAMSRLIKRLDDYIVEVKSRDVRADHHAHNTVNLISFKTEEERKEYDSALEEMNEQKAKLEAKEDMSESEKRMNMLVITLRFRQKAEWIRAPHLAEAAFESVKHGKAAVIAVNFKQTIVRITKILVDDYGVPRDEISLIWGGGTTVNKTKKQKLREKFKDNQELIEALLGEGIDLDDIGLESFAGTDAPKQKIEDEDKERLRLGVQSRKQRQEEIDRFQNGKSLYCMFTFKSGGVGLSLHHEFEHTRPREVYVAPTYSAIELVQGLGRAPRLTSKSDTPQTIIFYRGTIEEKVAARVNLKLKCLQRVIKSKESWEDAILGNDYKRPEEMAMLDDGEEGDAPDILLEGEDEETES